MVTTVTLNAMRQWTRTPVLQASQTTWRDRPCRRKDSSLARDSHGSGGLVVVSSEGAAPLALGKWYDQITASIKTHKLHRTSW